MDQKLLDLVIPNFQEVIFLKDDFVRMSNIRGTMFRKMAEHVPMLVDADHLVRTQVISNFHDKYTTASRLNGIQSVEAWMVAKDDLSEFVVYKSIGNPIQHEEFSFMIRNQVLAFKSVPEYFEADSIISFSEPLSRGDNHYWAIWSPSSMQFRCSRKLHSEFGHSIHDIDRTRDAFLANIPVDLLGRLHEFHEHNISGRMEVTIQSDTVETVHNIHYYPVSSNLMQQFYLFTIRPIQVRPRRIPFTSDLYKSVINSAGVDLVVFDPEHRYLFINENAVKDPQIREWMIGKTDIDYCNYRKLDISVAERRMKVFQQCVQTKSTAEIEETFFNQRLGKTTHSIKRFKPILVGDEVRYVVGYGIDITELKEYEKSLEQSERKFRDLFESSLDLIQSTDAKGKMIYCNRAWELKLGYALEEMTHLDFFSLVSEQDRPQVNNMFKELLGGKVLNGVQFRLKSKEGKIIELEGNLVPGMAGNEVTSINAFLRDISDRREKEAILKQSLAEKDSLLGEIHHRVKNNLTVVYSLLELQSMKETNEKIIRSFKESQTRIKAMALVHEKLYRSNSFSRIELKSYLSDLIPFIVKAIDGSRLNVKVKISGDPIYIDIRNAVPCGLLMNEIVTNACKYAFADIADPMITIQTTSNELGSTIEVKDNGPGLPEDFHPATSASLGMRLIKTFVNQLKGDLKMGNEEGLKYEIKLPNHESATSRR